MRFILCFLGFHSWIESGNACTPSWRRKCLHCGKEQSASYDMTYGETIWEDLR